MKLQGLKKLNVKGGDMVIDLDLNEIECLKRYYAMYQALVLNFVCATNQGVD